MKIHIVALSLVGLLVVLFVVNTFGPPEDPAKAEQRMLRRAYKQCREESNDPKLDRIARATIVGPACDKMQRDYVARYGSQP